MKVRKAISAAVVAGVAALLVLAVAGVFAPPQQPPPPPEEAEAPLDPGTLSITGFIVRRGTMTIEAERAKVTLEGDTYLTQPRLEMVLTEEPGVPRPEGEAPPLTTIRARAERGFQAGQDDAAIMLEGDVVIEAEGHRQGVIKAEKLLWDQEEEQGTFEGRVEFEFATPDGIQRGSCQGAHWDLGLRRGAMLSDVELLLAGLTLSAPESLGQQDAAGESAEAPPPRGEEPEEPTVVRCDGEAIFDGVAGLATLSENVVATQGGAELRCDFLELLFEQDTRSLREAVASGQVAFESELHGFSGQGDRLVRRTGRDSVELTGEPFCEVQYQGVDLVAPQIFLREDKVEAWGAGEMVARLGGDAPAEPGEALEGERPLPDVPPEGVARVEWGGRMEFSRVANRADFRRDVLLRQGEHEVRCRDLTVWFDEAGERLARAEATGDVRLLQGESEILCRRLAVRFDEAGTRPERAEATGDVHLREGENEIRCRSLTVRFDETGARPASVEATGDVRFAGVHGEGAGARLTVGEGMESFRLEGSPAVLAKGGERFEGREISVEEGGETIRSPGPGKLASAAEEAPAAADGLGLASGGIEASWTQEMLYRAADESLLLVGGVSIVGAEGDLSGERVAFGRKEGRIEVEGPGRMSVVRRPPAEGEGEGATGTASFLGGQQPDQPTRIEIEWRDGMSYSDAERTAEFRGGAKLRSPQFGLDADNIAVKFDENRDMASGKAEGDVAIVDRARGFRGKGRALDWDAARGIARLYGTEEDPAELDSGDGMVMLSRLVTFSNDFRTITMEAPRSRPR